MIDLSGNKLRKMIIKGQKCDKNTPRNSKEYTANYRFKTFSTSFLFNNFFT